MHVAMRDGMVLARVDSCGGTPLLLTRLLELFSLFFCARSESSLARGKLPRSAAAVPNAGGKYDE